MAKLYRSLPNLHTLCCLMALGWGPEAFASPATAASNQQDDTPQAVEPAEKDFEKIRQFASYDPATDTWSVIEDFQAVELLDAATPPREESYLYYSFWAYDMQLQRWQKVDISRYGYTRSSESTPGPSVAATTGPEPDQDHRHNAHNWWRRIGISCHLGMGTTRYQNDLIDLQLIERDGQYFLQTRAGLRQDRAYWIQWFQKNYEAKERFSVAHAAYDARTYRKIPLGKQVFFRGLGASAPLTLALHYTCFKRCRLGVGSSVTFHYLKQLIRRGDVADTATYTLPNPWLANIKWFGLVDFAIISRPTYQVHITTTLGNIYDVGSAWATSWQTRRYLYTHWCGSAGLSYEQRMSGYCKFVTYLTGEYKQYVDKQPFAPRGMVKLSQPALHLGVGVTAHLGKDTPTRQAV